MDNKEKVTELLMELDTEIGSTITFPDNSKKVIDNMVRANEILSDLKKIMEIEF